MRMGYLSYIYEDHTYVYQELLRGNNNRYDESYTYVESYRNYQNHRYYTICELFDHILNSGLEYFSSVCPKSIDVMNEFKYNSNDIEDEYTYIVIQ